jgi:DinB superfamily
MCFDPWNRESIDAVRPLSLLRSWAVCRPPTHEGHAEDNARQRGMYYLIRFSVTARLTSASTRLITFPGVSGIWHDFGRRCHLSKRLCFLFAAVMAVPVILHGQAATAPPANPITASEKGLYRYVSNAVIGAAQKMPEENYSFKPVPEVRSFGQLVGHLAEENYFFCSLATGAANPGMGIEKTKTAKADLVTALKDAVAYCNTAFEGMTDAKGAQMTKFIELRCSEDHVVFAQYRAYGRALREHGDLFADQGNCAPDQRKSAGASSEVNSGVLSYRRRQM